ncbi:protein of unknown function (DUF4168) [Fragilaria crotonensis]|nr:protein of unknown function (DUF4168) [Fragilaria crotonensis]
MLIRRACVLLLLLVEGVIGSLTNNPLASFSSKDLQIRDLESETMPSLFGPEEAQFDRYAACLAATEGLRRIRDKKLGGRRFLRVTDEPTEAQKRITSEYVVNSSKVLEAMGMSVSQFNQLGRQVGANSELKEKGHGTSLPLPNGGDSRYGSCATGRRSGVRKNAQVDSSETGRALLQ